MSGEPEPPCGCLDCVEQGAPVLVYGHGFLLAEHTDGLMFEWWRWTCSCGGTGRWQAQSDWAAYHSWRAHVAAIRRALVKEMIKKGRRG